MISLGNKINTDYIDFNRTDLTTYVGFIQPSISNYCDGNSAQIQNGNYWEGLTVGGNVNTTFTISDGAIVHSNGIMSITETSDARSIKFDVNTSSMQPLINSTNKLSASFITGLSTATTNITNANNVNGCNLIASNTIKNLSVVFPTTTTDGVNNILHKFLFKFD